MDSDVVIETTVLVSRRLDDKELSLGLGLGLEVKVLVSVLVLTNKNSSGDEIANVNFLRRYGTYVLQNTKKENLVGLTN